MRLFKTPGVPVVALLLAAAMLTGCAPGAAIDDLPSGIGLPKNAPERPANAYRYPAVHDMPPDRATTPLSAEQQIRLEKDLQAARDRQAGRAGVAPAAKPKSSARDAKGGTVQ